MKKYLIAALAALSIGAAFSAPVKAQNLLVCGDATTCPWQRGTTTATITNSAVVGPDFWYAIGGASSDFKLIKATQTGVQGYGNAIQMQRTAANTNTAVINMGQVLDTDRSTQLQGKTACLSYNGLAGADYSATGKLVTYTITSGTGTVQGYASMVAGTWTGTTAVATGTITLATTMGPFSRCVQIPATATEVGINFSWTPVGTAGTNDYIQLNALQFEIVPFSQNPQPTTFINRTTMAELDLALVRSWVVNEPAASVIVGVGGATTTSICVISMALPVPMRAAPTLSFAGTALGATTWAIIQASATPIVLATTFLVQSTLGANTTYMISMNATSSAAYTVGRACQLAGAGGGSKIIASADLL